VLSLTLLELSNESVTADLSLTRKCNVTHYTLQGDNARSRCPPKWVSHTKKIPSKYTIITESCMITYRFVESIPIEIFRCNDIPQRTGCWDGIERSFSARSHWFISSIFSSSLELFQLSPSSFGRKS